MNWPRPTSRDLPAPPPWYRAVGVGLVVMGMAMGTGELILWPHLVSKHGLGLLWLALVGLTFQYFINQEVARHALATGESFFTSAARVLWWSPPLWILAALLLYIWPGWASALGTILAKLFGFGNYLVWAWFSLLLVLLLTLRGRVAYLVLERALKLVVPLFLFLLLLVSAHNLTAADLRALGAGLTNFGFFPAAVDWSVLLGAIVFAGAGGLLNLCVSLWYRDKQAGMGAYVGRITNPITGQPEAVAPASFSFPLTNANLTAWRGWLRYIRFDQGIIFWLTGLISLSLLSVNAFVVLAPRGLVPEGVNVAVTQALIFSTDWGWLGEKIYLTMAYLMLFAVMWTVLDALARIITDVIHTNANRGPLRRYGRWLAEISVHHWYYGLIVGLIFLQSLLLPFGQPLFFLVISSALGGLTMALYLPLLIYLNNFRLAPPLRPGWLTNVFLLLATIFYWLFVVIIVRNLFV